MPTRGYEDFDTSSWPGIGPIKNSFVGTAAEFDTTPQPYEDFENGWIPWARFSDDDEQETFSDYGEFWEDKWGWSNATPTTASITWGQALFDTTAEYESFEGW